MRLRRFIFCVLPVFTACNLAITPSLTEGTSTMTVSDTPILTPVPDTYEKALHLFDYDRQSPPAITENSVQHESKYTVHGIYYPSPTRGNVTSYLLVPDGTGPFAGIILMHGSSGSRESFRPFANDLFLAGGVGLTIVGPAAWIRTGGWIRLPPQGQDEEVQLV